MSRIAATLMVLLALALPALAEETGPVTDLSEAQAVFEVANQGYRDGKYADAFDQYQRLYRSGFAGREVLANAGNAAYNRGDVGRAVLYYLRALRVDPDYAMARHNLDRIQPATNTVENPGAWALLEGWFRSTPEAPWVALAVLAFAGMVGAIAMASRTNPGTDARASWWSRFTFAAIAWAAFSCLTLAHGDAGAEMADAAVVIEDKAQTRLGPGEQYFLQLELPAGTIVRKAGEPEGGWLKVTLLDGRSGYIQTEHIERI